MDEHPAPWTDNEYVAWLASRFGETAISAQTLHKPFGFCIGFALAAAVLTVLLAGFVAYRLGVRHRDAQARQLRERLVGRLHPGAP